MMKIIKDKELLELKKGLNDSARYWIDYIIDECHEVPIETEYYFECHITIDPVFEEDRTRLQELVEPFGFKLAKLLMQKNQKESPIDSNLDTFMTKHGKDYKEVSTSMIDCCKIITSNGFGLRRFKIENIIIDSRFSDDLNLINR